VFGWLQADTVAAVWTAAAAIHREKNTVEAAAAAGLQPQRTSLTFHTHESRGTFFLSAFHVRIKSFAPSTKQRTNRGIGWFCEHDPHSSGFAGSVLVGLGGNF
jgi:hypothetical protein